MVWLAFVFMALVIAGLARLFYLSAREIRRDVTERFEHLQGDLEQEATNVLDELLKKPRLKP